MLLKISKTYNTQVLELQRMLNSLRIESFTIYGGQWSHLSEDGYFGEETQKAVMKFQSLTYGLQVDGKVGEKTWNALKHAGPVMKAVQPRQTFLSAQDSRLSTHHSVPSMTTRMKEVVDCFVDAISVLDNIIKEEIEYALRLGKCDPTLQINHFKMRLSATRLDKRLQDLETAFSRNKQIRATIPQTDTLSHKQPYQAKTPLENYEIRKMQGIKGKALSQSSYYEKRATDISKKYIAELKKFDVVGRVSKQLKKMGITGEIKISELKSIKIKAGGVFLAWSVKDIVWDLLQFDQWGEEQWQETLKKHCYEFLDQMIITLISTVIAQLIVAAIVFVAGLTIEAGVIVLVVAIVAIVVGLIIWWLIKKNYGEDFSFTKVIFEGALTKLFETIYNVKLI